MQSTDKTHILMAKAGDNVGNEYVTYFVQMCSVLWKMSQVRRIWWVRLSMDFK